MRTTLGECRSKAAGRLAASAALVTLFTACDGPSSALDPAGKSAERIATLFWWMTGGALLVWLVVTGLVIYAVWFNAAGKTLAAAKRLVTFGGVYAPLALLTVLLTFGLGMLPAELAPAPEGSLTVDVTGEQWWWRVHYRTPDGGTVALANELHVAVGQPTQLHLQSADVIHSFWVPALGGKVDMIPGRTTHLTLEPTREGVFHGVCAEYCGASHALMAFRVVVSPPAELQRWLSAQARPAAPSDSRGAALFLSSGCGACHTVRGTAADGVVGPDLTHVGSRLTLAAGTLPNQLSAAHRWLAKPSEAKPLATMPSFGALPPADLDALARYLGGLE